MTPTDPRRDDSGAERRSEGWDLAIREDLDRHRLDAALARQDASAELAREIAESGSLELGELAAAVDRLEGAAIPSFAELEQLLAGPEAGLMRVEGHLLADLLREGVEGQAVLKRGIAFLKHRKYASAVEWWSLNRRDLAPESSKLHLLLLIMEALTYQWAGDGPNAEATRARVQAHPLFPGRSSPGPPRG